jgi:hypothetical protein
MLVGAGCSWVCGQDPESASLPDEVRQTIHQVGKDVQAALAGSGIPKDQTLSLLPLSGDQGQYVAGVLKNAITAAGLPFVEGKDDPFWDQVLAEVAWGERKADMLDPATLNRFGRLKAARLLLYGAVRDIAFDGRKGFVEIELHVSSIETKQHLWGQVFARRFYLAQDMQGVVNLDDDARQVLRQVMEQARESLGRSPRLAAVHTVVMASLSGDIDGYAATLLAGEITRIGSLTLRDVDVQTLAEARQLLRDNPATADAILHGAVRDLHREPVSRDAKGDLSKVRAEVQLRLLSAASGDVLWAETVSSTVDRLKPRTSLKEQAAVAARDHLEKKIAKEPGALLSLVVWGGFGLVALLIGVWILRLLTRAR